MSCGCWSTRSSSATARSLFGADGAQVPLRLVSSRTLETGVQYVIYAPAEA